jgi:hypothetical protein
VELSRQLCPSAPTKLTIDNKTQETQQSKNKRFQYLLEQAKLVQNWIIANDEKLSPKHQNQKKILPVIRIEHPSAERTRGEVS